MERDEKGKHALEIERERLESIKPGLWKKHGFHGRDPVTLRGSRVHANSPEWFNHSKRKHATENRYGNLET